ncbi:MAG: septum formation initiator family protein [Bacillota bacterium]|nr:septum formation initiator family protein [Bacillota bacterium]
MSPASERATGFPEAQEAGWATASARAAASARPLQRPRPRPSPQPERGPKLRLTRPGRLVALLAGGALLFHLGTAGVRLLEIQRQLAAAEQMVQAEAAGNRALEAEVARRGSLAYMEQRARSEFGLVRPGETVYRLDGEPTPAVPASGPGASRQLPGAASSLGAALGALLSR